MMASQSRSASGRHRAIASHVTAATCWECDAATEWPVIVTLRALDREVGRLTLCTACQARLVGAFTTNRGPAPGGNVIAFATP
jgi:hypothetical protein